MIVERLVSGAQKSLLTAMLRMRNHAMHQAGSPLARRRRREPAPAVTGYTHFYAAIGMAGRARSRRPGAGGTLAMTAPRPAPSGSPT